MITFVLFMFKTRCWSDFIDVSNLFNKTFRNWSNIWGLYIAKPRKKGKKKRGDDISYHDEFSKPEKNPQTKKMREYLKKRNKTLCFHNFQKIDLILTGFERIPDSIKSRTKLSRKNNQKLTLNDFFLNLTNLL